MGHVGPPISWSSALLPPTHVALPGPEGPIMCPLLTISAAGLALPVLGVQLTPAFPFGDLPLLTLPLADHLLLAKGIPALCPTDRAPVPRVKSQFCCNRRHHYADCQCHRFPSRSAAGPAAHPNGGSSPPTTPRPARGKPKLRGRKRRQPAGSASAPSPSPRPRKEDAVDVSLCHCCHTAMAGGAAVVWCFDCGRAAHRRCVGEADPNHWCCGECQPAVLSPEHPAVEEQIAPLNGSGEGLPTPRTLSDTDMALSPSPVNLDLELNDLDGCFGLPTVPDDAAVDKSVLLQGSGTSLQGEVDTFGPPLFPEDTALDTALGWFGSSSLAMFDDEEHPWPGSPSDHKRQHTALDLDTVWDPPFLVSQN
eukprot:GGOE01021861.1.p1 GENE.GGOE01021861.1~~GGOE01021861.1.p1  ORF type:complete len:383 (-),score=68.09 GGOE01021861.1:804-1898(-)